MLNFIEVTVLEDSRSVVIPSHPRKMLLNPDAIAHVYEYERFTHEGVSAQKGELVSDTVTLITLFEAADYEEESSIPCRILVSKDSWQDDPESENSEPDFQDYSYVVRRQREIRVAESLAAIASLPVMAVCRPQKS